MLKPTLCQVTMAKSFFALGSFPLNKASLSPPLFFQCLIIWIWLFYTILKALWFLLLVSITLHCSCFQEQPPSRSSNPPPPWGTVGGWVRPWRQMPTQLLVSSAVPSVSSLSPAFIPSPQKPTLSHHSQLRLGELRTTFRQHRSEKGRGRDLSPESSLPASSSSSLQCPPPVPSLTLRLLLPLSFLLTSAGA